MRVATFCNFCLRPLPTDMSFVSVLFRILSHFTTNEQLSISTLRSYSVLIEHLLHFHMLETLILASLCFCSDLKTWTIDLTFLRSILDLLAEYCNFGGRDGEYESLSVSENKLTEPQHACVASAREKFEKDLKRWKQIYEVCDERRWKEIRRGIRCVYLSIKSTHKSLIALKLNNNTACSRASNTAGAVAMIKTIRAYPLVKYHFLPATRHAISSTSTMMPHFDCMVHNFEDSVLRARAS